MDIGLRKIIANYDPDSPLAEASTLPSAWYTDPRILELEQRTVFSHSWRLAGRSDQVRNPRQYITAEVAGEALLIVRGNDNVLRGFFNVCRHHAATVMTKPEGKAENLRCPYHGWTYDLEGKLILTPEFAGVANFDRNANGLVPVQIAEWQGWMFVKLESSGPALKVFLGNDLLERIEPLNLERMNWFERRSYMLNCNWSFAEQARRDMGNSAGGR
jgi:choline monooxygenase